MNRRGDSFKDNFMEIVLSFFGIIIVAAIIYSIFYNGTQNNSKVLLDSIAVKIDSLEDGESQSFVFSPKLSDFEYLKAWSQYEDLEDRPKQCGSSSCLCLVDTREENPICKVIDVEVLKVRNYELDYNYIGGCALAQGIRLKSIPFKKNRLLSLDMNKKGDEFSVIYNEYLTNEYYNTCKDTDDFKNSLREAMEK